MHAFYNKYGQIQPNYYAPHPKKAREFCRRKPLASSGYFVVLLTSPVQIALYESPADGEDELGDEAGAVASSGCGETDCLFQGGQEGGGDRSRRCFPMGYGGAL
jgi:hypothetical protein